MKICVSGAGGMVGGHLVKQLLSEGCDVRACDIKPFMDWHQKFPGAENLRLDLRDPLACRVACVRADYVYQLAANMGGIFHIETHKADCMSNAIINIRMLEAAHQMEVKRFFFSSSACAYPTFKQDALDDIALKESDAWPAQPEPGYGLEKLYSEKLCEYWMSDYGLETRVARFHNSYGRHGEWEGGREKSPAAICRKIALAKLTGNHEIEIWGDGEQKRSFMWVNDNVTGILKIMASGIRIPINLGSSHSVTINQLVDITEEIAGIKVKRNYDLTKPQGVRSRNSDNTMILKELGWEPSTPLAVGISDTYDWIEQQLTAQHIRHAL